MTSPDGLDQSWSFADPQTCANHGIKVVSMYLSSDPSKNATESKIKAYHRAKSPLVPYGIGVWLNWEEFAGAPLHGGGVGAQHGYAAAQQAKTLIQQVGYSPKSRVIIPASYDFDSNPGQYPVIDAYASNYKAQVNPSGFGAGGYGEADLIEHLHAKGFTEAEWQTYAWSGGRLSSEADFYQYMNGQTFAGASVDFNKIIHGPQMGAWWPPGHPLDTAESGLGGGTPITSPTQGDWFDMATAADLRAIVKDENAKQSAYLINPEGGHTHGLQNIIDTIHQITVGDGADVPAGSDTHPPNLKVILAAIRAVADPAAIAAAVVAALPPGQTVTAAQIADELAKRLTS